MALLSAGQHVDTAEADSPSFSGVNSPAGHTGATSPDSASIKAEWTPVTVTHHVLCKQSLGSI